MSEEPILVKDEHSGGKIEQLINLAKQNGRIGGRFICPICGGHSDTEKKRDACLAECEGAELRR